MIQDEQVFSTVSRLVINVVSYPVEYAKILMQIGHEPIPPRPTTRLFGQPALALPNVFQYVKFIKNVDGIHGCYRGVVPKMCAYTLSAVVHDKTSNYIKKMVEDMKRNRDKKENRGNREQSQEEPKEEDGCKIFLLELLQDLISRMVAVIVSHPLDVIAIRMIAQFVGRETKYTGLFRSFIEVYRENGLMGYYAGLVPRLIGSSVAIILFSTTSYVIDKYILSDEETKPYVDTAIGFVATSIPYPFLVVSHCMAVNNCGLVAGLPPHMPIYKDWMDCWSHLYATNQLKRAHSLLWRYYSGQYINLNGKPIALTQ